MISAVMTFWETLLITILTVSIILAIFYQFSTRTGHGSCECCIKTDERREWERLYMKKRRAKTDGQTASH